jgi:hypothetical protein
MNYKFLLSIALVPMAYMLPAGAETQGYADSSAVVHQTSECKLKLGNSPMSCRQVAITEQALTVNFRFDATSEAGLTFVLYDDSMIVDSRTGAQRYDVSRVWVRTAAKETTARASGTCVQSKAGIICQALMSNGDIVIGSGSW